MNHGSAVTWRRDGTVHPLTTIDQTFVQGVVWQDGQFTILSTLGGGSSAFSINDHGTIAGFAFAGLFPRAVIWTRLTN